MERLDVLVRQVRDQTGNQQYTATQGIRQREFVRYANDAQMRIYNKILMERSTLYMREGFLNVSAGTASYGLQYLSDVIFLKHNILKVDYSQNGDARNYTPLTMRSARQEVSAPGYPDSYFLRDGYLILSPIPTQTASNALRLNYQYTLPTLDIRRARVEKLAVIPATTVSWTAATGTTGQFSDVATDGTGFMAVGIDGSAIYSAAGSSWASTTATGFGASDINAIAYGDGRWIIGGQAANVAVSSDNGVTWTAQAGAFTPAETVYDIVYADDVFVVVGTAGSLYTGTRGLTWTARTSGFGASFISGVCYNADDEVFAVVGDSSKISSSTDGGATWTLLTTNLPAAMQLQKIVYSNGVYLTISSSARLFKSTDLTTWTELFVGQHASSSNLSVVNDVFYMSGGTGGATTKVSFNGTDWYAQTITSGSAFAGTTSLIVTVGANLSTHPYTAVPTSLIGLSLVASSITTETSGDLITWNEYLTIVDKQGTQLLTAVEAVSYDSDEAALAVTPITLGSQDSEAYITFGTNSTTHSQLPDVAQRYLTEYMAMRIQMRDSNSEANDQSSVLRMLEEEIIDSIANLEEDMVSIAILDSSMMNYDEGL